MHVRVCAFGGQKRVVPSSVAVVSSVSHLVWVLETELQPSARAASFPNR